MGQARAGNTRSVSHEVVAVRGEPGESLHWAIPVLNAIVQSESTGNVTFWVLGVPPCPWLELVR